MLIAMPTVHFGRIFLFTHGTHVGLVGLCSEEVQELMAEEHPQKYQEYIAVVQEREFQATRRKKIMESKRIAILVRLTPTTTFIAITDLKERESERGEGREREGEREREREERPFHCYSS